MEELELFHISSEKYKVREVVNAPEETNYHKGRKEMQQDWVDDLLDSVKPANAPSRKSTLFAFDKPFFCTAFRKQELRKGDVFYLYKVKMLNPYKAPMTIVGRIEKKLFNNDALANAYWDQTFIWNFYEYLSVKMEIIEEITITEAMINNPIASELIEKDFNKITRDYSK